MARQGRRRAVVTLGIPGLIVAILTVVALWRVGRAPVAEQPHSIGTTGEVARHEPGGMLAPLTTLAEVLGENTAGREASLENVEVRQLTSARTFWAGRIDDRPVFVVLASADPRIQPGGRVTIVGTVAPAPASAEARREWGLDEATARAVEEGGVYLRATRVVPAR
jgi:hypothetical protein